MTPDFRNVLTHQYQRASMPFMKTRILIEVPLTLLARLTDYKDSLPVPASRTAVILQLLSDRLKELGK